MPDSDDLFELLQEAEDRDQLVTARLLYEAILDREPEQAALLVLYAANLIELGDLSAAGPVLLQAQELNDEEAQPGLLTQLGNLARARGEFAEAQKHYRSAHKLSPDDAENLLNAAAMASGQEEIAKAEYLLREAAKIEGDLQIEALYNLAGNLVTQQRYEEACSFYERILETDPKHELAKEWLSDLRLHQDLISDFS